MPQDRASSSTDNDLSAYATITYSPYSQKQEKLLSSIPNPQSFWVNYHESKELPALAKPINLPNFIGWNLGVISSSTADVTYSNIDANKIYTKGQDIIFDFQQAGNIDLVAYPVVYEGINIEVQWDEF